MPGLLMPIITQRRWSNETSKLLKTDLITSFISDKKQNLNAGHDPFDLKIRIESPPLVAFGPPEASSGALLSGILELCPHPPSNPADKTFEIAKLEMKLVMQVTTRLPISYQCPACTTQSKVLNTWLFIPNRFVFAYNNGVPREFPFSFLVPGNSPATTQSSLAIISYKLIAEATSVNQELVLPSVLGQGHAVSPKQTKPIKSIKLEEPLLLSRCILPAIRPDRSHRGFAPTSLTATVTLPTVISPGTTNNVRITLSGISVNESSKRRWSLRRITWRIDEMAKVLSRACEAHTLKLSTSEGRGILYKDRRTVGEGDCKSGWTQNFPRGKIECVIHVGTSPRARAACHVDAMSGVHVSHKLVIECVVAEEVYQEKGGQYQTCGDPLKLRMLFPMLISESQGMGISWDEEIPPRYEDVAWNAPPTFAQSERFTDAAVQESMDDMETLEGIQRVMSPSPPTLYGPSSGEFSSFGDRLSPIDSDSGAVST
jgi:arrestin-related trafficking adapter 1